MAHITSSFMTCLMHSVYSLTDFMLLILQYPRHAASL